MTKPKDGEGAESLLPCPFCGGKSTVSKRFWVDLIARPDTWRASCVFGCGRSSDELTEASAIKAWNRRAPPATPVRGGGDQISSVAGLPSSQEGSDTQTQHSAGKED